MIIYLINIETLQIIFKYYTDINIEENLDLVEENIIKLFSKIETGKEPLFYIDNNIDEIPFFK